MEPDFERFRTAILCDGEPDHVPFVDIGVYSGHKARLIGHSVQGIADEIEFARRIGYDFVPVEIGLQLLPVFRNAEKGEFGAIRSEAAPGNADRSEDGGRRWVAEGSAIITSHADFEAFDWPDPADFDYSAFAAADQIMPPNMKVICVIGKVFNPVWWLMGFENFSIALYDNPGLIERLFEKVGSIQYAVLERALAHRSVGAYWHADDVAFKTSLMVSPAALRKYAFPCFTRLVELAHARGVPAICHTDGKVDSILEDIIGMGFDAFNPVEPPVMDIVEVKKKVQGRLCVMGNIDLGYTLTRGSPQEVNAEVRERIRTLAPGGGYCLSSSNSIPDYVPFDNYIAMHDAWLEYGKYPIQLA